MAYRDRESANSVFISYAWGDESHQNWVVALATRLRRDGIDVLLDRWELRLGDQLPAFMENAISRSSFVLVICTSSYKDRADKRVRSVGYEENIITAEVWRRGNHRKYIPVLREGDWDTSAPAWALPKLYIDLRDVDGGSYAEGNYVELLRTLHGSIEEPPPLGSLPPELVASSQHEHQPTLPASSYERGRNLFSSGLLPAALPYFVASVRVDPMNSEARYFLVLCALSGIRPKLLSMGHLRRIEAHLKSSLDAGAAESTHVRYLWATIRHDCYALNGLREPNPSAEELLAGASDLLPERAAEILSAISAPGNRIWERIKIVAETGSR